MKHRVGSPSPVFCLYRGMKIMESAAVLKRGVGYEMSRLGHYLTQVYPFRVLSLLETSRQEVPGDDLFLSLPATGRRL